jgi:hypothetical protein
MILGCRPLIFVTLFFAGCAQLSGPPSIALRNPAEQEVAEAAWVEFAPGGQRLFRVAQTGLVCPVLQSNQGSLATQIRPRINSAFPGTVCEATLGADITRVDLGTSSIDLSQSLRPERILIIGDTGCRVKSETGFSSFQNCNAPDHWPLAQVAAAAAAWKPQVVIHVGDYHYREAKCPPGNKTCAGSVAGDVWESWMQDFFRPAKPLLDAAPWVFVRGNHELCKRGGNGWFQFLDPRSMVAKCVDATDPYLVQLADHSLAVIDAADEKNIQPSLEKLKTQMPSNSTWLTLHRPFLTPNADDESSVTSHLPAALMGAGKISAVFTGHQHNLSINQFPGKLPPEIISGNGSTELFIPPTPGPLLRKVQASGYSSFEYWDFGFLTLERKNKSTWLVTEHDRSGKAVLACDMLENANVKTNLVCHTL